jgi:hypothetical protein
VYEYGRAPFSEDDRLAVVSLCADDTAWTVSGVSTMVVELGPTYDEYDIARFLATTRAHCNDLTISLRKDEWTQDWPVLMGNCGAFVRELCDIANSVDDGIRYVVTVYLIGLPGGKLCVYSVRMEWDCPRAVNSECLADYIREVVPGWTNTWNRSSCEGCVYNATGFRIVVPAEGDFHLDDDMSALSLM